MSLPVTRTSIAERSNRLARLVADQLAKRQNLDGTFTQHSFYAPAFAAALWAQLDPALYAQQIEAALCALEAEQQTPRYHREFIEYGLRQIPGLSDKRLNAILRTAPTQSPDVANWQVLGMINRHLSLKKGGGKNRKLINWLHWAFIRLRYWRTPLFWDRPTCFSGQYHAFCAALLTDSPEAAHRIIADKATALIAKLSGNHGYANLLGRGAGQSFGAVCALYALSKHGFHTQADAVLFRLENAFLTTGTLPLNLFSTADLPDDPGPANPKTPGWYSYNRHDDYLAFAGYWLLKIATNPTTPRPQPTTPKLKAAPIAIFSTPAYQAQMCLGGKHSFDLTPCPVVLSGSGNIATLLFAPTGGEEDAPSLYGPASIPLPATSDGKDFAQIRKATRCQNTVHVDFTLAGISGNRTITFEDTQITITDQIATKCDLLRLLVHHEAYLTQTTKQQLHAPDLGITFKADQDLAIEGANHFTTAGLARRVIAPHTDHVTLRICWGTDDD
ncbi:hypothetical protein [Thalassospira lucentensis]|uniref:hypothetical protein n=1 Tax=Thalassospira lucentensis TaxID=168935 RepID=UPI0003B46852|nr:hypothetical protein [Thalassospira lucentensis]RCK29403.1 hypothetical protein TH1_05530 [Thalassospira lucentensis MCCC 1A00383 = DSM 14000]